MLDFIWGGLGSNRHPPVHPRNPCPPSYYPPQIQNQRTYNPSFNYYNHSNYFPNTSCCLIPQDGSIAKNIFNGSIFSPPQTHNIYLNQGAIGSNSLSRMTSPTNSVIRFYV